MRWFLGAFTWRVAFAVSIARSRAPWPKVWLARSTLDMLEQTANCLRARRHREAARRRGLIGLEVRGSARPKATTSLIRTPGVCFSVLAERTRPLREEGAAALWPNEPEGRRLLVRSGALLRQNEPGLCRRALFWQNEPEASWQVAPGRSHSGQTNPRSPRYRKRVP